MLVVLPLHHHRIKWRARRTGREWGEHSHFIPHSPRRSVLRQLREMEKTKPPILILSSPLIDDNIIQHHLNRELDRNVMVGNPYALFLGSLLPSHRSL